jgi:hypothetical protein
MPPPFGLTQLNLLCNHFDLTRCEGAQCPLLAQGRHDPLPMSRIKPLPCLVPSLGGGNEAARFYQSRCRLSGSVSVRGPHLSMSRAMLYENIAREDIMKRSLLSIFAISLFALLHIDPAAAQADRTWVSGVGDDVNPCSRTAPCKTFPGAISKTATGGEINCLDPGGFGAVTITKSITISCPSTGTAGITAAGVTGVIVNTPAGAEVLLEGLDIDGFGTGSHGVNIISNTKVTIQKSSIRNFSLNGVNLAGQAGARVVIIDSVIVGNNAGVAINGVSGATNVAVVLRTLIDNNNFSVVVGNGGTVFMSASLLFGSLNDVILAGGTFTSFGNNAIQGTGNPTTTIPLR